MARSRKYGRSANRGPVISKTAINEWLNRDLANWDYLKDLKRPDLQHLCRHRFAAAGFNHPISYRPLFNHQLACLYAGILNRNFLYFLEMGLGKTQLILSLFSYRKCHLPNLRAFITVPREILKIEWAKEIARETAFSFKILEGSSAEKYEVLMNDPADIFVGSYGGIRPMLTKKEKVDGKNKQVVDVTKAQRLAERVRFLAVDESQDLGNKKSLTFKTYNTLSKHTPFRYAITGTPFGRDAGKIWSQFYLIDKGATLGKNMTIFREALFRKEEHYFGFDYYLPQEGKDRLNQLIKNRSISYSENECFDVPNAIRIVRHFDLAPEIKEAYTRMMADFSDAETSMREHNFHRKRQLTSGYFVLEDGDVYEFPNPEADLLLSYIERTSEKVIVFVEYHQTGHLLERLFRENKVSYARVYGETEDYEKELDDFRESDKKQVFLASNSVGARGLNLQISRTIIFYESPVKPDDRLQAEKRVRPRLQSKRARYIDLCAENTVDTTILSYIEQGKDLYSAVVHGGANLNEFGGLT